MMRRELEEPWRTDDRVSSPERPAFPSAEVPVGVERLRRDVPGRDRTHHLRGSETVLLGHVGAFRGVRVEDLEHFGYRDDATTCREDQRSLKSHGFLLTRTQIDPRSGQCMTIVTLTKEGARLAKTCVADPRQAVYSDVVKPRELPHDAAVYRMYHAEAARIERAGGRVRRVLLDYELRRQLYRELKGEQLPPGPEAEARRDTLAEHHGLAIAGGAVQIPDLRIEFEQPRGDLSRVDVELATSHYRARQLAAKAQAGFTIYAPAADVDRLHAMVEERDLMVEILAL